METIKGEGCWGGRAAGIIFWVPPDWTPLEVASDRGGEVVAFRREQEAALADLERWISEQPTVEGRLVLQPFMDTLFDGAWTGRVIALIDQGGYSAASSSIRAATDLEDIMARSPAMRQRGLDLIVTARWLARRLAKPEVPSGGVLATDEISPLELLEMSCPVIMSGPEPPVQGNRPLVWGVPHVRPDWQGKRVRIDGATVDLDVPDQTLWVLGAQALGSLPLLRLDGDLADLDQELQRGSRPAVFITRLDDLAAVPLFARKVSAIAIGLGQIDSLLHPGVQRLIHGAIKAAHSANVPILAGGDPVALGVTDWLSQGFTALFYEERTA